MGINPQELLPKVEQHRVSIPQEDSESSGKGPYLLSSLDTHVNANIAEIAEGKASWFISGFATLLAGIDFSQIKYFAPIINHHVAGYYKVLSYDVIDATELLDEGTRDNRYHGYDKPYRVKLELADYKALDSPFTYGLDRNAAKGVAMPAKVFKEYCKKGIEENSSPIE